MSARWGGSEREREATREQARQRERDNAARTPAQRPVTPPPEYARPQQVQLSGLVLLQMIRHARSCLPTLVSGRLLGCEVGGKVEVSHSFPYVHNQPEAEADTYQSEQIKLLRATNVDQQTVGWYQAAYAATFFDSGLLEAQCTYQKHLPHAVVIVYDPFQAAKGRLVIKAYRLSDAFMRQYSASSASGGAGRFSYEEWNALGLDSSDIFQSVPIQVHNSHLVHGFLYELREEKANACRLSDVERRWSASLERVSLSHASHIEKSLSQLGAAIEQYSNEQGKFQFFVRAQMRQKAAQAELLKKRAQENEARVAAGKEPVPDDDLQRHPLFKQMPKPNRIETELLSNQIAHYADNITQVAHQSFQKLHLVEALQRKEGAEPADVGQAKA